MTDETDLAARVAELERANVSLMQKLDRQKRVSSDVLAAVYQAVQDAGTTYKPIPKPRTPRVPGQAPEVAVAMSSDAQDGKVTESFNMEVFAKRARMHTDKIIRVTELQRKHHPVTELHLWLLGDSIEGELIFPHQPWQVEAGTFSQVMHARKVYCDMITDLLDNFESIKICAVPGNHGWQVGGRGSRFNPETNWDRVLYEMLRLYFREEPRITWDIAYEKNETGWYCFDDIGKFGALLIHGYQARSSSYGGVPWYGLVKRAWSWHMTFGPKRERIPGPFDVLAMGHYHQTARLPINQAVAFVNGSYESDNPYALEQLAAASNPQQWLMYVDPRRGRITAQYALDLL